MAEYTTLKGFNNISDATVDTEIEASLVSFYDWGLIDKGAIFNINIPTSGQYYGTRHRLRLVSDPNFTLGQVWEGARSNWVWESGLTTLNPISISGSWVNNTFYPLSGTGSFSHYIDYPKGRVVFNTPIATGSRVEVAHSYKWVSVYAASTTEWFKEIQYGSLRNDNRTFNLVSSGNWFELGGTRVQMPAIVFEEAGGNVKPYALGGGHYCYRDFICHVFAENERDGGKLANIINIQDDKSIYTLNLNGIAAQNRFPLTDKGSVASGALTYPQMVDNTDFRLRKLTFLESEIQPGNFINKNIYHIPVRLTTEVILGNI